MTSNGPMLTDEAREAFTSGPMGWKPLNDFGLWETPDGFERILQPDRDLDTWRYRARIALEEKLGYSIRFTAAEQWETWSPDMIRLSDTCDAAIEAGVMDWWKEQR